MFVPHPFVSISLQRSDRQGWQEAGSPENQVVIPKLGQGDMRWLKGYAPGRVCPGMG